MKIVRCIVPALLAVGIGQAQWSIRESELPQSNLSEIARNSPHLVHVIPDREWDASNFAEPKDLEWFKNARFGMFIHFGLSTYQNRELSWGVCRGVLPDRARVNGLKPEEWGAWKDQLKLENFNAEELADIIRQSGVKYLVVVTKHHEGFHQWDTRYSDFKITNTPYGKDFVAEVVRACRMAGVKVGFYYSQRDWYHPDYAPIDPEAITRIDRKPYYRLKEGETLKPAEKHQRYIDYQFKAVRELCTKYGKIDIFWFDASYWNNMFRADMWEAEKLTRMIRELQPGIIINNRTSLPGDFDTPEQRIGMFQNRRPWETCMSLGPGWSYAPGPVKTPQQIFRNIQSAAIGDGNLLLSWGMKWDGAWDDAQKKSFIGVGDYLKRYGRSIYGTRGGPWLPNEWRGTTYKGDKIYVHVLKKPDNGIVSLGKLNDLTITGHAVMGGQATAFRETPSGYEIDLSGIADTQEPLILELTASRPVTVADVERQQPKGKLFSDRATYGEALTTREMRQGNELLVDLGRSRSVKGIEFKTETAGPSMNVTVSLSQDGDDWTEYATFPLAGKHTEKPVAREEAGALIEGIDARYVRLAFSRNTGGLTTCTVYGL